MDSESVQSLDNSLELSTYSTKKPRTQQEGWKPINMNNLDRRPVGRPGNRQAINDGLGGRDQLIEQTEYGNKLNPHGNTCFTIMLAVLSFVLYIATIVGATIFQQRDLSVIGLCGAVSGFVGLITCFLSVFWLCKNYRYHKYQRLPPSTGLTGLIGCLNLGLAIFKFVSAFQFVLYRKVHLCKLRTYMTSDSLWNMAVGRTHTLNQAWDYSSWLLTMLSGMSLANSLISAIIAYIIWNGAVSKYKMARAIINVSSLFGLMLALGVIYWTELAKQWGLYPMVHNFFRKEHIFWMQGLSAILIIVLIATIVCNVLRKRGLYLVVGIILLACAVCMLILGGNIWRQYRNFQDKKDSGSDDLIDLSLIHRDDIQKEWCPRKYLETCMRDDLTQIWEDPNLKESYLNPACECSAKQYLAWPFFMSGLMTTLLSLCAFLSACCSLYLSDTRDQLESYYRGLTSLDIGALVSIIIVFILWAVILWCFGFPRIARVDKTAFSFFSPKLYPNPNYQPVDKMILEAYNPEPSLPDYQVYRKENHPQLLLVTETDENLPTCESGGKDCIFRVGILMHGGNFETPNHPKIKKSNFDYRTHFFPGCVDASRKYGFWYGSQKNIRQFLWNVRFTPETPGSATRAYIYLDQVPKKLISSDGVTKIEKSNSIQNDVENSADNCEDQAQGLKTTFVDDESCENIVCRTTLDLSPVSTEHMIYGWLYYVDQSHEKRPYTSQQIQLVLKTGNNQQISKMATLNNDGSFVIQNIPVYYGQAYLASLDINDPEGRFLSQNVDLVIQDINSLKEDKIVNAGKIRLLTVNGNVCPVKDQDCISKQKIMKGEIEVEVVNGDFQDFSVRAARILIKSGYNYIGPQTKIRTTNSKGVSHFRYLNLGSYTVVVTKKGFKIGMAYVNLQNSDFTKKVKIILEPYNSIYEMKLTLKSAYFSHNYFELGVKVQTKSGQFCEISRINQYCAYGAHFEHYDHKGWKIKTIALKRMVLANYMVYYKRTKKDIEPVCPQYLAKAKVSHYFIDWNAIEKEEIPDPNHIVFSKTARSYHTSLNNKSDDPNRSSTKSSHLLEQIFNEQQLRVPENLPIEFLGISSISEDEGLIQVGDFSKVYTQYEVPDEEMPYTVSEIFSIINDNEQFLTLINQRMGEISMQEFTGLTNSDTKNLKLIYKLKKAARKYSMLIYKEKVDIEYIRGFLTQLRKNNNTIPEKDEGVDIQQDNYVFNYDYAINITVVENTKNILQEIQEDLEDLNQKRVDYYLKRVSIQYLREFGVFGINSPAKIEQEIFNQNSLIRVMITKERIAVSKLLSLHKDVEAAIYDLRNSVSKDDVDTLKSIDTEIESISYIYSALTSQKVNYEEDDGDMDTVGEGNTEEEEAVKDEEDKEVKEEEEDEEEEVVKESQNETSNETSNTTPNISTPSLNTTSTTGHGHTRKHRHPKTRGTIGVKTVTGTEDDEVLDTGSDIIDGDRRILQFISQDQYDSELNKMIQNHEENSRFGFFVGLMLNSIKKIIDFGVKISDKSKETLTTMSWILYHYSENPEVFEDPKDYRLVLHFVRERLLKNGSVDILKEIAKFEKQADTMKEDLQEKITIIEEELQRVKNLHSESNQGPEFDQNIVIQNILDKLHTWKNGQYSLQFIDQILVNSDKKLNELLSSMSDRPYNVKEAIRNMSYEMALYSEVQNLIDTGRATRFEDDLINDEVEDEAEAEGGSTAAKTHTTKHARQVEEVGYLVHGCFTGYGDVSFFEVNKFSEDKPEMVDCGKFIYEYNYRLKNLIKLSGIIKNNRGEDRN